MTPRQRQVLTLLLAGLSNREIAANLGVSPKTLDSYIHQVYVHFKVSSFRQLVAHILQEYAA